MYISGNILTFFALWSTTQSCLAAKSSSEGVQYIKNQFIIKYENTAAGQNAKQSILDNPDKGIALINEISNRNIQVVSFPTSKTAKNWLAKEGEGVKYFEQDSMVYLDPIPTTHRQIQNLAETTPYGINHVKALDVPDDFSGNRKVCIVDSGYDITHPDLPSGAGLITGESFVSGSWNTDGNSHGTHVAGTVAAIGGNGIGVKGVIRNGQVKLHISRVFPDSGGTSTFNVIAGFNSCVTNGANVINMSLGGGGYTQSFADAIAEAEAAGILTFASSGNSGDGTINYPASYPHVISVASITENYTRSSFSTYNSEVDICAPGSSVLSTIPGAGYSSYSGTSMASPHAAGVAALVWSHYPDFRHDILRNILQTTARDLGTLGRDDFYGHGLIDAKAAYDAVVASFVPTLSPSPTGSPSTTPPTEPCKDLVITVLTDNYASETTWTITDPGGTVVEEGDPQSNQFEHIYEFCLPPKCDYTFTIYDNWGDGICCSFGSGSYTVTYDNAEVGSGGSFTSSESVDFGCVTSSPIVSPTDSPTVSPTDSPTVSPTVSPTDSPTASPTTVSLPTTDMCIPAGSNCFTKHSKAGCNDQSCAEKVCDVRDKCCNNRWGKKCKRKAEELCTSCVCTEDIDGVFLLKVKNFEPVEKTCAWLQDQSEEKRNNVCKKTHSHEGIQAARLVCPMTCELEGCNGN